MKKIIRALFFEKNSLRFKPFVKKTIFRDDSGFKIVKASWFWFYKLLVRYQ